jgi:hypothetical protein
MQGQNVLFFQPINLLDQINLEALEVITLAVLMNYPVKTGGLYSNEKKISSR